MVYREVDGFLVEKILVSTTDEDSLSDVMSVVKTSVIEAVELSPVLCRKVDDSSVDNNVVLKSVLDLEVGSVELTVLSRLRGVLASVCSVVTAEVDIEAGVLLIVLVDFSVVRSVENTPNVVADMVDASSPAVEESSDVVSTPVVKSVLDSKVDSSCVVPTVVLSPAVISSVKVLAGLSLVVVWISDEETTSVTSTVVSASVDVKAVELSSELVLSVDIPSAVK